jgi:hypothetical protein
MPTSGYFETLANATTATFALNAQGLGLPSDMFEQFAILLSNITDAYCIGDQGGWCYMYKSCSEIPELWDLQFQVKFTGSENYVIVPVGSFSFEHNDNCYLQVEPLISGQPMSDQIVFGSLFMQNFKSQFVFNYTIGAPHKTHLLMRPTQTVPLVGTYSGSATYTTGVNPFDPVVPEPSNDDSSSALVWILVIAGVALVCLGIAIVFYFKAKSAD